MNPNSQHQLWSKWIVTIRPNLPFSLQPNFKTVGVNTKRFMQKLFGRDSGICYVRRFTKAWVVECLIESRLHPHDKQDFDRVLTAIVHFYRDFGFGMQADVRVKARLMAGSRLDGKPPDQMLILPRIELPSIGAHANGKRVI